MTDPIIVIATTIRFMLNWAYMGAFMCVGNVCSVACPRVQDANPKRLHVSKPSLPSMPHHAFSCLMCARRSPARLFVSCCTLGVLHPVCTFMRGSSTHVRSTRDECTLGYRVYAWARRVTPFLFRNIMSLPTSTIGLILFVRPASMSVMALSPKFIPPLRRAHPALGILGGSICILVSMLAFMALESDAPIYLLVAVLVVQGLGLGLANPMLMTVITLRVPTDSIGTVSAIVTMLMTISSSVGMVMMLAIVASLGGVFELSAYWCVPNRHAIISIGACHHAERAHTIMPQRCMTSCRLLQHVQWHHPNPSPTPAYAGMCARLPPLGPPAASHTALGSSLTNESMPPPLPTMP